MRRPSPPPAPARPRAPGAALVVAAAAAAASLPPAAEAQEGAAAGGPRTQLQLVETASREVEQDVLVVTVTARAGAGAPREAQAAVNAALTAAADEAGAVAGVRRATGGYRVFQERDRNGQPRGWVAEQDLRLTGRDAGPLLELAGALQAKGLVLSGLAYALSPEARRALEGELTAEALAALRTRAEAVAGAMGLRLERFDRLRVGSADEGPPPRERMRAVAMAESAAAAPPVALPDVERVALSVEAEAILRPR